MARILASANGTMRRSPLEKTSEEAPSQYRKLRSDLETPHDAYTDFIEPEELRIQMIDARRGTFYEKANGNCDLRDSNAGDRWGDMDNSITFLGHVRLDTALPRWVDVHVLRWMKDGDFVAISERPLVRALYRVSMKELFVERLGFPDLDNLEEEERDEPGFELFVRYIQGQVERRISALGDRTRELGIWWWDSDTTRKWDRKLVRRWDEVDFDGIPRAREAMTSGTGLRRTRGI